MAIISDKFIYLHPPKTGGTYISHLLKKITKTYELGHQHIHFPELFTLHEKEWFAGKYIFTTIRHPISWYQSRWAFRVKTGWKAQHPLDFNCASNDFKTFVNNVLQYKPDGWVTHLMNGYINEAPYGVNKILRMEDGLGSGLLNVMKDLQIRINPKLISNMTIANSSDSKAAKYSQELYDRVMKVEGKLISRYYHNFQINPQDYIE